MNYYIYILFIPMMFISNFLMIICSTWISLWMIMELNMFSLILMLMFDKNIKFELLMKYYLIQSLQSYLYLINSLATFTEIFLMQSIFIMNFAILMKLSLLPFHFWYIKILMKLNWHNIYFFTIINKLIPLFILNNIFNMNLYNNNFYNIMWMNYPLLLISSFFSSIIGMNQMNLKSIMGYSSMIQMSWIIIIMNFNEKISLLYFIIYNFISMNMFSLFNLININNLIQMNSMKMNYNLFLMNMMMMMSLSGLPPFFGFLMKWISIQLFMNLNFNFYYLLIFIFNSLISMFFYFRIMFMILMNYYLINKINFKFINLNNLLNIKYIYLNLLITFMIMIYQMM